MTGLYVLIGFVVVCFIVGCISDAVNKKPAVPCRPVRVLGDDGTWHQLNPDECQYEPDEMDRNPHAR